MITGLRRHLTYANVVSTICLFVVLGGTSYAAVKITGKDVKPGTLTSAHIKDGSLLRKDFKKSQLPIGAPGPQGAAGAPGAPGPQGAAGAGAPPPPPPPPSTPIAGRVTITRSPSPIVFAVTSSSFGGTLESVGGGSGAGKVAFEDLVVTKDLDASSDDLTLAAVKGTHFATAKLELLAPGSSTPSATLELGETMVAGVEIEGSGSGRAETVRLRSKPEAGSDDPPKLTWTGTGALPGDGPQVGEMTLTTVPGTFALTADAWGVENDGTFSVGGAAGKATVDDLTLVKRLDPSSPQLLKAMKTGIHFAKAEIKLLAAGGLSSRYVLSDVLIDSYRLETDSAATETLSLSYDKIEQFIVTSGGEQKACWEVAAGQTC